MKELAPIFNPGSLVGLSPEEISQGVRLHLLKQEIEQKGLNEAQDFLYKLGVEAPVKEAYRKYLEAQTGVKEERHQVKLPDGTTVTLSPKELTDYQKGTGDIQEYRFYHGQEIASGRAPKSFYDWQRTIKEAGAMKIDRVGEYRQKKEIDLAADVKHPDFISNIEKSIDRRDITMGGRPGETDEQTRARLVWTKADEKVKAAYPGVKFLRRKSDGQLGWFDANGELIKPWGK